MNESKKKMNEGGVIAIGFGAILFLSAIVVVFTFNLRVGFGIVGLLYGLISIPLFSLIAGIICKFQGYRLASAIFSGIGLALTGFYLLRIFI